MKPTPKMVKSQTVTVNALKRQFNQLKQDREKEQERKWERVKQTQWK